MAVPYLVLPFALSSTSSTHAFRGVTVELDADDDDDNDDPLDDDVCLLRLT